MSGPIRKRPWHRQRPYEKRAKIGPIQRETMNMENQPSSSSSSTSTSSTLLASGENAWNYLLRRKAEYINDRINKAKAERCYEGTASTVSQFLPINRIKEEPQSPTNEANNVFTLSEMTSQFHAVDSSHNYDVNTGFCLGTTGERYREAESNQTFSQSMNDQESNTTGRFIYVKTEPPWNGYSDPTESGYGAVYSSEFSEHCHRRNNLVTRPNQTMHQNMTNGIDSGNCDTKQGIRKNVIGNSLSVQKLIANIRNAVATNQEFKTSEEDSTANQTPHHNVPNDSHVSSFATAQSFGRNNLASRLTEQTSMLNGFQDTPFTTEVDCTQLPTNSGEGFSGAATRQNSHNRNTQSFASSKTLIHSLPYPAEGVEVVYTVDPVDAEAWLRNNIIDCSAQAVGLDIEWKPQFVSKKKGGVENKTAVLQLGVETSCLVLHLGNMKALPKSLRVILADRKILKVGSGILQDAAKLKRDTGLKCVGMMDTQKMAKSMTSDSSQKLGLKALAERFLGIELEKPKHVSRSNWEKYPLTIRQIHYAALDAWIGFKLYQQMKLITGEDEGQTNIEDTLVEDEVDGNPAEIVVCQVCGKKCLGNDALTAHVKIHVQCKCGKFFQSKVSKDHKRICAVLNPDGPKKKEKKPKVLFPCHLCKRKCRSQIKLNTHMNSVHAQCKCGQYFVAPVVPKTHQASCPALNSVMPQADKATSASDNTIRCQGCGKKCKTEEHLMKHIREAGHVQCPFCSRLLTVPQATNHIKKCKQIKN